MPRDYRHIEKDPIIDLIRTVIQMRCGGHDIPYGFINRLSVRSGVSTGAIHNWLFGETKRPQQLSTKFVLSALDVETTYIDRLSKKAIQGFGTVVDKHNVIQFEPLRRRKAA